MYLIPNCRVSSCQEQFSDYPNMIFLDCIHHCCVTGLRECNARRWAESMSRVFNECRWVACLFCILTLLLRSNIALWAMISCVMLKCLFAQAFIRADSPSCIDNHAHLELPMYVYANCIHMHSHCPEGQHWLLVVITHGQLLHFHFQPT